MVDKKQFSNTKSIVKVETGIVTLISYHHYLKIVGNNKLWTHMQKENWNIHEAKILICSITLNGTTGACYDFFLSLDHSNRPPGRNLTCQIFIQHFFKIVLHWCLELIRHNIGTHLKHNKYIFDISIPFCHHLYLSATLKQCFTEFAVSGNVSHHVYMSVRAIWMVGYV
jgi:hypothetical protein